MVQYLAKRIGRSILTLFVIVTLVSACCGSCRWKDTLQTTKK